jgi:hypothetical protein
MTYYGLIFFLLYYFITYYGVILFLIYYFITYYGLNLFFNILFYFCDVIWSQIIFLKLYICYDMVTTP